MITADDIVGEISEGVINAFQTSKFLLGAASISDYPQIKPEYLVTVEVAKRLSQMERKVGIETHMESLQSSAHANALTKAFLKYKGRTNHEYKARRAEIEAILAKSEFQFSPNGTKRIDIAVFSEDCKPLLIAEAKLGGQAPDAIIADIDRVIKLLKMHRELGVDDNLYGAVFFYRMLKGGSHSGVCGRAKDLLNRINSHLENEKTKPDQGWIRAKAGLLTRGKITEPVQVYEELHDDGSAEDVFARKGFSFAPGLILLGHAEDIQAVTF